jgi:hypothetical protein
VVTAVVLQPLLPETPHAAIRARFKSRFVHSATTLFRSCKSPARPGTYHSFTTFQNRALTLNAGCANEALFNEQPFTIHLRQGANVSGKAGE